MDTLDFFQSISAQFESDTRLYGLKLYARSQTGEHTSQPQSDTQVSDATEDLMVEGFVAQESLQGISSFEVIALSTSAYLSLVRFTHQTASLLISLSDRTQAPFTGIVHHVAQLGSEGGLARYRIRIVSWLWLLTQQTASRVWQDKSVIEIVDQVFSAYAPSASWRWSDEALPFLEDVRPRSYCVQYRETDYAFVSRLLGEEGLTWRTEESSMESSAETPESNAKHAIVIVADTTQIAATPEDYTSQHALGGAGIRYHAARSQEEQDTIIGLSVQRQLQAALTTVITHDYKAKQASTAKVQADHTVHGPRIGGAHMPLIEQYDSPGLYHWADNTEANRYATLHREAIEARNKTWLARSTVRTLRPGTRFTLTQSPLSAGNTYAGDAKQPQYVVTQVHSLGINNLPKAHHDTLAEMFGSLTRLLSSTLQQWMRESSHPLVGAVKPHTQSITETIRAAQQLGYANRFEALRADIPWRPMASANGAQSSSVGTEALHTAYYHPKPTAEGGQTALVIGPNGETTPHGADETHCDQFGRIRIRFLWQSGAQSSYGSFNESNAATCWVRVAHRSASGTSGSMGSQFLPRIGQEVQLQFIENDIDRPLVIGALYNGQGEGGISPTTAGQRSTEQTAYNLSSYQQALDQRPSAQSNRIMGTFSNGNSPAWHGMGAGNTAHQNTTSLWGIRTKEHGANGYNQLQFDDTHAQGCLQLATTQAGTQLNLGHLIHHADNYRGSFRGLGVELRTDAYGAIRAGAGSLITSYAISHQPQQRDPIGDNTPGIAHLKQASQLAHTLNTAANTHQTVQLASHIGSHQSQQSQLAPKDSTKPAPALQALHSASQGTVHHQHWTQAQHHAAKKHTQPEDTTVPHTTDPILQITGKAGLSFTAQQHLQLANGELATLMSGMDTQTHTGGQARLHTGQTIGLLAGAIQPSANNIGLQLITAQDKFHLQAQQGTLKLQAKHTLTIQSSQSHIDWAAAKSITLRTAAGATIVINGGIDIHCPGNITIHASKKSWDGPGRMGYDLPLMPTSVCKACLLAARYSGSAFAAK